MFDIENVIFLEKGVFICRIYYEGVISTEHIFEKLGSNSILNMLNFDKHLDTYQ